MEINLKDFIANKENILSDSHIEYINKRLDEEKCGLEKFCTQNNISRSTLKRRASASGYNYNSTLRVFEKNREQLKENHNSNNIDMRLDALENTLNYILKQINNNTNPFTKDTLEIKGRALNNDIIIRSIRVSKDVMNDFIEFTNNNFPQYNKQILINQALLEFIDKYK